MCGGVVMALDTKSEQLLQAASDKLQEVETELRSVIHLNAGTMADKVRQAHYLIYLVLKPDTRLIREPVVPMMPPAKSKPRRKK